MNPRKQAILDAVMAYTPIEFMLACVRPYLALPTYAGPVDARDNEAWVRNDFELAYLRHLGQKRLR